MNGQTFLIIKELKNMVLVKDISDKYGISQSAVYQIASKYNINTQQVLTEKERKEKKKKADAKRNKLKKNLKALLDPNTEMPKLPMTSAKFSPLSALNSAWITGQGNKRSSDNEHIATQAKYGLKT